MITKNDFDAATRTFTITRGAHERTKDWRPQECSLDDLRGLFLTSRASQNKSTVAFVPGVLAGGQRQAKAVEKIEALVYDVDGAMSLSLFKTMYGLSIGNRAFVYTTHSHRKTRTFIETDSYRLAARKAKLPEEPKSARDFAAYFAVIGKPLYIDIRFDPAAHLEHRASGQCYVVDHAPVDKFRVVFPLKEPIRLAELSRSSSEAIDRYRRLYMAVGRSLGLKFDTACATPQYLFYLPSHVPGAEHEEIEFEGALFDWKADAKWLERVLACEPSAAPTTPASLKPLVVQDRDGVEFDLADWSRLNRKFDMADAIAEVDEGVVLKDRPRGGYVITCPFEDEHTTPGGEGTFVDNPNGDHGWIISCSHHACQGRRSLDFLAAMIRDGTVTAADLKYEPDFEALSGGEDAKAPKTVKLYESISADSVEQCDYSWWWEQKIARGKLNIVAGDPDLGKSTLLLGLAAVGTRGGLLPDGTRAPLGSVVIVQCEDDIKDTVVPRLEAAGADLGKVKFLKCVRDPKKPDEEQFFDFDKLPALEQMIDDLGDVALVIIEPVLAYMGERDSYKAQDVRRALGKAKDVAERTNTAFVMITHFNKASGFDGNALNRLQASGAYGQAVRSTWIVAPDKEDEDLKRRFFVPAKNNVGDDEAGKTGFAYTIERVVLPTGLNWSKVVWHEPVRKSANEILAAGETDRSSALSDAKQFLQDELKHGARLSSEVEELAKSAGIKARTLDRARRELGVRALRGDDNSRMMALPKRRPRASTIAEDFEALRKSE